MPSSLGALRRNAPPLATLRICVLETLGSQAARAASGPRLWFLNAKALRFPRPTTSAQLGGVLSGAIHFLPNFVEAVLRRAPVFDWQVEDLFDVAPDRGLPVGGARMERGALCESQECLQGAENRGEDAGGCDDPSARRVFLQPCEQGGSHHTREDHCGHADDIVEHTEAVGRGVMGRLGGVDAGVPVFEQRLDVRVPRPRSRFRMLSALFSQQATSLRASHYPHVGQTRTTERSVRRMSDREGREGPRQKTPPDTVVFKTTGQSRER